MNKYEIERLGQAIEERGSVSCYLEDRLMVNGGSNIDTIDVNYDDFLALGKSQTVNEKI